ncbi:MAG: TatD family hydrolase [Dehalococcoidia bacterium]|nr:TatD family hydrolase [Dehalococcoidia bacterium]
MTLPIIDTHAHLDMKPFDKDRAEIIDRARKAGITRIVTIGIDLESSRKAIELAEAHQDVFATVGFHPHDASQMQPDDIERMAEMAHHPRVVAIGEMGLDFYRNKSPKEVQVRALEWQLELADRLSLPIVIHCREAATDMTAILSNWIKSHQSANPGTVGVIHCFNGNAETVQKYLDMGFCIAIGAYIGYPTSLGLHDVVRSIPADRLLVETDCPFLPPQAYRGKRNEPSYLPGTVDKIAAIRSVLPQTIAERTTQNAIRLFRFSDSKLS